jgi:putative ABC transport system permease protein
VLSAAISTALPLQGETWIDSVFVQGDTRSPWERPMVNLRFVSADYLRTMGIRLVAGRTFSENDRQHQVAIISERLANTLWPGQDAVGRQFQRDGGQRFEVIGIAGDVRADVAKRPVAMVYRPYWDWPFYRIMVVTRAARDPRSIAGGVRAAIRRLDPDLPVPAFRTMQEMLEESVAQRRFQMLLAAVFAATALLLASVGIYGVVSYSVTRRTNEMGLRLALGAESRNLCAMVLRQAMTPVTLGLAAGVVGALAAGRLLSSLLYEVSPSDPLVIGAVVLLLFSVALAACYLPARRATRVDPLVALRYE